MNRYTRFRFARAIKSARFDLQVSRACIGMGNRTRAVGKLSACDNIAMQAKHEASANFKAFNAAQKRYTELLLLFREAQAILN